MLLNSLGGPRPARHGARTPAPAGALLVLHRVARSWLTGDPRTPTITPVLRDVSLQVDAGETVAVVAEPGAGGSTLLLVAAGIARPDSGSVHHMLARFAGGSVHLVPTRPALPGSATPRELLLQRARGSAFRAGIAAEAERHLRHPALARVADLPLRQLPAYVAWFTTLAAARMLRGLLLVDRPPDEALPLLGVDPAPVATPALAVAERANGAPRVSSVPCAELHLVRNPHCAPRGARVLVLRSGELRIPGANW